MSSYDLVNAANIIPIDRVHEYVSPETEVLTVDGIPWVYYNGQRVVELGRKKALDNCWVHPEPRYQVGRCKMVKADGERCQNAVRPGWTVCRFHGAGSMDSPGGRPPVTGRHSTYLPTKMLADYDSFIQEPQSISLRDELALTDVRIAQQLQRLESHDSDEGWNKVRTVYAALSHLADDRGDEKLQTLADALLIAMNCRATEEEVWQQITKLVDLRRKVADTERRHIEAAKKYLTLPEANAMMAYIVDAVMKNVSDPLERNRIAEAMKVFAQQR